MRKVERLLWKVTAVAVLISMLGFVLVGVSATNDGGDTSAIGVVGVVALVGGIAIGFYAAVQWVQYLRAKRQ